MDANNMPALQDKLLDIKGYSTKVPLTKKLVIATLVSVAVYFLISLVDLSAYGEMASRGLGLFVALVLFMVFSGMDVMVDGLIMIFLGIALSFWQWKDVQTYLGSSQFYSMLGMVIVAMGCEFTPFGRRVAYFFLEHFGQKPKRMVIVFGAVTALMSAFVSNIATLILMSSIAASVLEAMGEKPGESNIGKALMLLVAAASMFGGCALISGSPYGNAIAISMMENASEGVYTVSYAQWAFFGCITFLVLVIPFCMIYIKCSGVKNSGYQLPTKEYYEEKKKELGKLGGSEVRWVIIVVVMVALMIAGKNTAEMAMLFAMISFLPVIGTTPVRESMSKVPLRILMCMGIIPMMSKLLTTTGVVDWLTDILKGNLNITSPLLFSIVTTLPRTLIIARHLLHQYGFHQHCAALHAIDLPVLALEDGSGLAQEKVRERCIRALKEDGSGAIVLGCGGMATLAQELTRELRVPVIDGVSAAVKMVESLVALGLATSKHGDLAFPEKKALSGQFQSLNPF